VSVSIEVYVEKCRLPTAEAWRNEIRSRGFALEIDPFDLRWDNGFRPCRYGAEPCGFEYDFETVEDLDLSDEPELEASYERRCATARPRDCILSFVTHSSMTDAAASAIAAATLAAVCDGRVSVEGSETLLAPDAALAMAREALGQVGT
jgi:hypothetical protein